jgi:hypothetical protein
MVEQIYLQLTHLGLFIKHLIVIQISNVNQLDGPFNFPVQQDVFVAVCYLFARLQQHNSSSNIYITSHLTKVVVFMPKRLI